MPEIRLEIPLEVQFRVVFVVSFFGGNVSFEGSRQGVCRGVLSVLDKGFRFLSWL